MIVATPPWSEEAEQSILGSFLREHRAVEAAIEAHLSPEHFYRQAHQVVYRAVLDLYNRGIVADVLLVGEELHRAGQYESVGGSDYLLKLWEQSPSAGNVGIYAGIVRGRAKLRQSAVIGRELEGASMDPDADADAVLDQAAQQIYEVAQDGQTNRAEPASPIVTRVFAEMTEGKARGLMSGLHELDRLTTGFKPGELVIVAARPSVGKSSFASCIALHVALESSVGVGIFHLEMSRETVVANMICTLARVDTMRAKDGSIARDEELWARMVAAGDRIMAAGTLHVWCGGTLDLLQVRAEARRLVQRHKVGLLIVDYLQLMQGPATDSRQQEIAAISRGLKALARDLNVPILALSQLNRAVESRDNPRPRLADLRDSGAIEQDADVVLMLYRDDYQGEDQDAAVASRAHVLIAKNRNGRTGEIDLDFDRRYLLFQTACNPAPEPTYDENRDDPRRSGLRD